MSVWSSDVCFSDLAADEQARASSPDGGDVHPSRLARWNGDPGAGVVHARSHRLCGRTPQKHHRCTRPARWSVWRLPHHRPGLISRYQRKGLSMSAEITAASRLPLNAIETMAGPDGDTLHPLPMRMNIMTMAAHANTCDIHHLMHGKPVSKG